MTNINQIYDLMPELIDDVKEDGGEFVFSERAKAIVKEIADYARSTKLYARSKEQGDEFWKDGKQHTAREIYLFMLDRIVNAPTAIHRNSSVILHIPYLDEELNGKEETV